jgi:hypothetical protein
MAGELAPHSETLVQTMEVNATDVPGSNAFLPGETLLRQRERASAETVVVSDKPGAGKCPLKHEHRKP